MGIVFLALLSIFGLLAMQSAPADGTADIGPIIALVVARALALTTVVKVAVDIVVKIMIGQSGKYLPLVAIVMAIALDLLLNLIGSVAFTGKAIGLAILTGIMAGAGAVAVTEVHKATSPV